MSDTKEQKAAVRSSGYALYDKHGIPMLPGDTVKVFHYIAAVRRERRYMYKLVLAIESRDEGKPPLLKLSHWNLRDEWYFELMDGRRMEHYEIVQGFGGVPSGNDYRDRERQQTATVEAPNVDDILNERYTYARETNETSEHVSPGKRRIHPR